MCIQKNGSEEIKNILAKGDNLTFMKHLAEDKGLAGKIQMIYIDPPFFSKAKYGAEVKIPGDGNSQVSVKQIAYTDTWESGLDEYLKMLCVRFYMMKDLLSDEGCLWLHLDWHVVHYAKVLLDEIFGEKNFVNEIVWQYKSGGSSKKHYSRKHDTLLFYSKTNKYYFEPQQEKSYNRGFKPYRFKGVKEYRDELGWYTMVNMKDVWQIDMVGRTSSERTGYATQKPEALLARIIESCSREGDIVADFFGGSGTLCAAASKLGRNWIYCDAGNLATAKAEKRLFLEKIPYALFVEKESGAEVFSVNLNIEKTSSELTDKDLLKVELLECKLESISKLPLEKDGTEKVKKVLENNSLALIEYWMVDYNYDGQLFKPSQIFIREKGNLTTCCEKFGSSFEKIAVKVVDVFGNSFFAEKTL